jgi:hypothetical protein
MDTVASTAGLTHCMVDLSSGRYRHARVPPRAANGSLRPIILPDPDSASHTLNMVNGQEFSFTLSAERSIFEFSLYPPPHPFTAERIFGIPETAPLSASSVSIRSRTFLVISSSISGALRISTG